MAEVVAPGAEELTDEVDACNTDLRPEHWPRIKGPLSGSCGAYRILAEKALRNSFGAIPTVLRNTWAKWLGLV